MESRHVSKGRVGGGGRGGNNVQNSPIGGVGLCGPSSLGTCKNS